MQGEVPTIDLPLKGAVGVVVIGRNEGERLRRCLESVMDSHVEVVYVDSGSTDDSVEIAQQLNVHVLPLNMSLPFSAARARNEGFLFLAASQPKVRLVQFVDGDCELVEGWLSEATQCLDRHSDVAVVAGRLHERFAERSIYNQLGELEWNAAPAGEVAAVGGIFMVRCSAFSEAGMFNSTIAAGEEPELCQRLGNRHWRLLRLDRKMAWHDLDMSSFRQWWTRAIRFGYGSADVAHRFGLQRFRVSNRRAWIWTLWLVIALLLAGNLLHNGFRAESLAWFLFLIALWPLQLSRLALRTYRNGPSWRLAIAHAFFGMVVHWPQCVGQAVYWFDRARKRGSRLYEYRKAVKP